MNPAALVFLETREARQLAAAWPAHFEECVHSKGDPFDFDWTNCTWFELAGLDDTPERQAAARNLLGLGICLSDGTLDPMAERFIADAARRAANVEPEAALNDRTTMTLELLPDCDREALKAVIYMELARQDGERTR